MGNIPKVDLIVSSPPYVTSYEYADLHQLSALWLGYATDYRELRNGSIGSAYNSVDFNIENCGLNEEGEKVLEDLQATDTELSQIKSVARYYSDIQSATRRCSEMIRKNGMVLFVVGDTEYKGAKIMNSKHLIQTLRDNNFSDIKIAKRRISRKILTPYRDEKGRFSTDSSKRSVYHEEYIISGRMCK
jgi:methylase of polypeptide subunit release factors